MHGSGQIAEIYRYTLADDRWQALAYSLWVEWHVNQRSEWQPGNARLAHIRFGGERRIRLREQGAEEGELHAMRMFLNTLTNILYTRLRNEPTLTGNATEI